MQPTTVVPWAPTPLTLPLPFREQDPAFAQPQYPVIPLYTEFYCESTGSNLNGGSNTGAVIYTSAAGNWSTVTNVFTPTDGTNPATSGVRPGQFASIYVTIGATVAVFIARIISVVDAANGGITVDATAKAGTAPTTASGTLTIKVGGAWQGPNAGTGFPISLPGMCNAKDFPGHLPRINMKNDAPYSITTGIAVGNPQGAPLTIQGYTSTPGDLGKATIDGGTSTILLLNDNGIPSVTLIDLIVQNNGTTGTNNGFSSTGGNQLIRCVANNVRGNGFFTGSSAQLIECEAYACNGSNTAGAGGFNLTSTSVASSCISHDNLGSNNDGFVLTLANLLLINCISSRNGRHGYAGTHTTQFRLLNCDAYYNGQDGYRCSQTTTSADSVVRNCNFVKNGGYGINGTFTTGRWTGLVDNCAFSGGALTNNTDQLIISNSRSYPPDVTPWLDPTTGKFNINLAAAIGTGRGAFSTTAPGYGPTVGYPDIGAAPAQIVTQAFNVSTTQILSDGFLGHPYNWKLVFSQAVDIVLQSGTLPTGLVLTKVDPQSIQLAGTPTVATQFVFTLRATIGTSYGDSTYQLTVNANPDEGIGGLLGGLRPTC